MSGLRAKVANSTPALQPSSAGTSLRRQRRRWIWALAVVLGAIWFGPLEHRELFRPDEGRYAEVPREMVESGDWLTPRLNDLKYFEKPPLQYWATALAYAAFGVEEWTARLWPALAGFLGLFALFATGCKLFDLRTGLTAMLLLASTLIYALYAQIATLDMGLAFFLNVGLYCFLLAMRKPLHESERQWWLLGAWVAAAFAVLSKGLIGIVLPALTLLLYCLTHRDWRVFRTMPWGRGCLVFFGIAAPWFVLMQLRNPEFFDFFFIHEHITRFAQSEHKRIGAWYYYLPIVLVGALPWTSATIASLPRAWRQRRAAGHDVHAERFLLTWVLVIVGFFSLSSSKLPGYILPAFPALALLCARWAVHAAAVDLSRHLMLGGICGFVLLVAGALAPRLPIPPGFATEVAEFSPWLIAGGLVLGVGLFLARVQLNGERRLGALLCATIASLLAFQVVLAGAQQLASIFSGEKLIDAARRDFGEFDATASFYSLETYDQTLPLHLRRTLTLVNYRDEFDLGLRAEPAKGIPSLALYRQRWKQDKRAYAFMPVRRYEEELEAGTPMQVMARDSRYVLAQKPATEALPLAR